VTVKRPARERAPGCRAAGGCGGCGGAALARSRTRLATRRRRSIERRRGGVRAVTTAAGVDSVRPPRAPAWGSRNYTDGPRGSGAATTAAATRSPEADGVSSSSPRSESARVG